MIATNNGSFPWRGSASGIDLAGALLRRDELEPEHLRALQDRVTREVVDLQVRAGLDLVTDGMVRRTDPIGDLAAQLLGFSRGDGRGVIPTLNVPYGIPVAHGEVSWKSPILVEDYLFATQGATAPVKVVLIGPYTLAHLAEDRAYGDPMSLAMATAIALNQELRALQAAGATFLQIDEPMLLAHKDDFPLFTRIWEVLGRGVGATLALHLEGGSIEGLYPGLLRLKRLGCLSVDCVSDPGSLDLLATAPFPEELLLGLGLADGRSEIVEIPEALAALVGNRPGLPPGNRILLGTASDLGRLPPDIAAAKLRALAAAARSLARG